MKRASAALTFLGALLCAAVLLHCGGSEVVGRGGSEVVGKLVDRGNQPVSGATVSVYKDSLDTAKTPLAVETTDKNGNFVAHVEDPGTYFLFGRYKKDTLLVAYIPDVLVDSVAPDKKDPYQYSVGTHTLLPPGSVSGRVTVYSGQNALILVDIPGLSYLAHTDNAGNFKISNIPPGTYPIRFSKDNFKTFETTITITSGRDTTLAPVTLALDPDKPIPAPLGLTATPDTRNGTVTIRWNKVPVSDLYGYVISRAVGASLPVPVDTVLKPDTVFIDIVYSSVADTQPKKITYTIKSMDRTSSASLTPASVVVDVVPPFTVTPVFQSAPRDTVVDFNGTVVGEVRVYCRVNFKVLVAQPGNSMWTEVPHDSKGLARITFGTDAGSTWGKVSVRAASAADTVDTFFTVRVRPRPVIIVSANSTDSSVTVRWNRSQDSDFSSYMLTWRAVGASDDQLSTLTRIGDTMFAVNTHENGTMRFSVGVIDTEKLTSARSAPKNAGIINSPPRFSVDPLYIEDSVRIGSQSTFPLSAVDINNENLSFSLKTPLPGLSISNNNILFEPEEMSLLGPRRIVVLVKDEHGGVDSLVWNVKVVAHDVWAAGDSLNNPRRLFGAVTLNGQIYVIGGQSVNLPTGSKIALKTVEAYDTATGTWTLKRPLDTARWAPMVAVWNNKIYAFGGSSERNYSITSIEVYDPQTDTWSPLGKLPFSRSNGTACVIGNNLYCIGGKAYDPVKGFEVIVKAIDIFNLTTGEWSQGPAMRNARSDHRVCVNNGLAYIIGGTGADIDSVDELSDGVVLSSIEVFNPAGSGRCDSFMTLQGERSNFGAVLLNNRIYCIGGLNSLIKKEILPVEIVDVALKESFLATSFDEQRFSHQCVALGGKIYCIGGLLGTESTGSVMVYYP